MGLGDGCYCSLHQLKWQVGGFSLSVGSTHGRTMASRLLLLEGIYGAVDNGIVIFDTPQVLCRGEITKNHQLNECNCKVFF